MPLMLLRGGVVLLGSRVVLLGGGVVLHNMSRGGGQLGHVRGWRIRGWGANRPGMWRGNRVRLVLLLAIRAVIVIIGLL